ncbi:MAG: hypothetical protein JO021_10170 [Alphaproteobacteria bacterium]|nr:hypothetical protein [Alphaproteobacteria bacterium]
MGRKTFITGIVAILLVAAGAARAETYSYTIQHPTFGDIGSYVDRIERTQEGMRIETTVHIAVRALGIVVHREDAQRSQEWHNGRLIRFEGVTTTNGNALAIHGEARGDHFVVDSPNGTATAPADVVLSDPWQATRSRMGGGSAVMLSTKTGKIETVHSSGGDAAMLSVHGVDVPARHYVYATNKQQDVWLSERGIPLQFRTVENGTPIDFTLSRESLATLALVSTPR